uniref:Uncharacterized protein n=1 Tax=viral metagenome TaxID=1070528 RepID=A0A6C0CIM8_9ZZZZ
MEIVPLYVFKPVGNWTLSEPVRAMGDIFTRFPEEFLKRGFKIVYDDDPNKNLESLKEYLGEMESPEALLNRDKQVIVWSHEAYFCGPLRTLKKKYPNRLKIVVWYDDLHSADIGWKQLLQEIDRLVCPYNIRYMKGCKYQQIKDTIITPHSNKVVCIPYFVYSHRIKPQQSQEEWTKRFSAKVTLAGYTHEAIYPVRNEWSKKEYLVKVLKFPGYYEKHKSVETNDRFYEFLSKHAYGISTSDAYGFYFLAKYLELPAMQLVMFAQHHPQLKDCGFVENVHYKPLDENTINNALEIERNTHAKYHTLAKFGKISPERLKAISQRDSNRRKQELYEISVNARKLIVEKHTEVARFDQLCDLFKTLSF